MINKGTMSIAGVMLVAAVVGATPGLLQNNQQATGPQVSDSIQVNNVPTNMRVTKWTDLDGDNTFKGDSEEIQYQETSHNVITDQGLNSVECAVAGVSCPSATSAGTFSPGTDNWDYISVGTGTAPTSGSTSLDSEVTGSGLARTQSTPTDQGTGNFTVSNTFTASADVNGITSTGLHWSGNNGDDDLIAGNTFDSVDLNDGDKLTITWSEVSFQ